MPNTGASHPARSFLILQACATHLSNKFPDEVPVSVKAFVLSFAPDMLANGQTQWDITD
jgi:hypothetical protein